MLCLTNTYYSRNLPKDFPFLMMNPFVELRSHFKNGLVNHSFATSVVLFVFSIIVYFVLYAEAVVFELMLEGSYYYSSCNDHLCNVDRYVVRTSLSLHNFGRRFYGCREWTLVSLHLCLVTLFVICHKFLHFALIDIVIYAAR